MKPVSFILALILLAASFAPCFDKPGDILSSDMIVQLASDNDQNQSQEDNCSPFCICSCCVASADTYSFRHELQALSFTIVALPVFNQNPIINAGIGFWQPPKLS